MLDNRDGSSMSLNLDFPNGAWLNMADSGAVSLNLDDPDGALLNMADGRAVSLNIDVLPDGPCVTTICWPGTRAFDVSAMLSRQLGVHSSACVVLICATEQVNVATPVDQLMGQTVTAVVRRCHMVDTVVESAGCDHRLPDAERFEAYMTMLRGIQLCAGEQVVETAHAPPVDFMRTLLEKLQDEFDGCWTTTKLAEEVELLRHDSSRKLWNLCVFAAYLFGCGMMKKSVVINSIMHRLLSRPQKCSLPEAHCVACACELLMLVAEKLQHSEKGREFFHEMQKRLEDLVSSMDGGVHVYPEATRTQVEEMRRVVSH
eukprot:TRINITY_DN19484_c0_g1_i2.p1 TRINITY_DN19484_c0_g1~~TRINITY_DN19484_c0_g1_i2.p1  ORF type:complete len:316 (-),score=37.35 TRINITY_DN19484_c0_g1_i2:158-1105(-)